MSAPPSNTTTDPHDTVQQWLRRLDTLVEQIEGWAKEWDWSTRRIEKQMNDPATGRYDAPALLLQRDTTKILLEPIAPSAPGALGVVDLYLMPAYDDIASLYLTPSGWQMHYMFPGSPTVATIRDAGSQVLSKETLGRVLTEMTKNGG